MKNLNEMVWPEENYTIKIHQRLEFVFNNVHQHQTINSLIPQLKAKLPWLKTETPRQIETLSYIINTGLKKLIQLNKIKKVYCDLNKSKGWISIIDVGNYYKDITGDDNIAVTESAINHASNRACNKKLLFELNHK